MSTLILSDSRASIFGLEHVSDVDLLTNTRQLVGRSNQLLAALLAHLAEVSFPSSSSRSLMASFKLTTLLLLGPHLTEANHLELLAFAKYRTKREVLRLVRHLAPEPDVPDRIEPLGPIRVNGAEKPGF